MLALYTRMRVLYYVVYDPQRALGAETLYVFENTAAGMRRLNGGWMEAVQLGVTLWDGTYEGVSATWLRWCDAEGRILLTGEERAEVERQRAERLAARLRALGIDPETDA